MPFLNCLILNLLIFNFVGKQLAEVAKTAEIVNCPTFCYCDLFDGLNRANCSSQRLLISNVTEVPLEVEILDLSYNDIFQLDKDSFVKFVFLKSLTISHSYIGNVHSDTFDTLRSITSIDLSHNGLEFISEKIIKKNRKLQRLNLSENRFRSLGNKPILRSPWLRSLKLRNAKISYLYPDIFIALPNLRELDVSANRMLGLNIAAFRGLTRLEYLNLTGNFWGCDTNVLKGVKLLQKRDIKVESDECDKIMHVGIWSETNNKSTISQNMSADPALRNIWHHLSPLDANATDDDEAVDNVELVKNKIVCEFVEPERTVDCNIPSVELCYKYRKCLKEKVQGKKIDTGIDLYFMFLVGFVMGIIFVICFISCAMFVKRWCAARLKKPDTTENHITESEVSHTARPLIRPTAAPTVQRSITVENRPTPIQRVPTTPTDLVNLFQNPLNQHLQTSESREHQSNSRVTNRGPIPSAPSISSEENATPTPVEISEIAMTVEQPAAAEYNNPDTPPPSYFETMANVRK